MEKIQGRLQKIHANLILVLNYWFLITYRKIEYITC